VADFLTQITLIAMLFYDDQEYPDGIFDELLSIPSTTQAVKTRTYLDLVQSYPVEAAANYRYIARYRKEKLGLAYSNTDLTYIG